MSTWYSESMTWYSPVWSVVTGGDAVLAGVVRELIAVCEEGDVDMVLEANDVVLACVVRGHKRRRNTRLCGLGPRSSL